MPLTPEALGRALAANAIRVEVFEARFTHSTPVPAVLWRLTGGPDLRHIVGGLCERLRLSPAEMRVETCEASAQLLLIVRPEPGKPERLAAFLCGVTAEQMSRGLLASRALIAHVAGGERAIGETSFGGAA